MSRKNILFAFYYMTSIFCACDPWDLPQKKTQESNYKYRPNTESDEVRINADRD